MVSAPTRAVSEVEVEDVKPLNYAQVARQFGDLLPTRAEFEGFMLTSEWYTKKPIGFATYKEAKANRIKDVGFTQKQRALLLFEKIKKFQDFAAEHKLKMREADSGDDIVIWSYLAEESWTRRCRAFRGDKLEQKSARCGALAPYHKKTITCFECGYVGQRF